MTTVRAPAKIIPRAFPGIRAEEVQEIIINSRIRSYPPGTVVCRENQLEYTFYMILEGDFEVLKSEEQRLLTSLTAGDYFGEMALLQNAPRAATVRTKTNVVVLELDQEGFNRVLKRSPSVAMAMVSEVSNRLRNNESMPVEDLRLRASELADAYNRLAEQDLTRRSFLSTVAAEMRSPLTIIASQLRDLLSNPALGADAALSADVAVSNMERMTELVNDLLFMQELELVLPEFQPVDLVALAESVIKRYENKALARQVTLKLKGDRLVSKTPGAQKCLERALSALVDNAIKFNAPGKPVEVRLMMQGSRVLLSVEDQGAGIAPEFRPRIFEHVARADVYGGANVSLALARQIILQHKGSLDVESKPGRGSVFVISLPAL